MHSADFRSAAARRRFYLDMGLRKRPMGSGSDMATLMQSQRETLSIVMESLFGDIPAAIGGGIATRAYAPERKTPNVDVLVAHSRHREAVDALARRGWQYARTLSFRNGLLGLYGTAWVKNGRQINVISTDQLWGDEALSEEAYDQTGLRILPLPYLVLMKIDSARGIDQGDLTRMLGLLDEPAVERVVDVVRRHYGDPHGAEDVRQYAMLGKLEYWTPEGDANR
jgi:hypothetical protein